MILLDTNVISELIRPIPNAAVANWIGEKHSSTFFISVITEEELRFGIAIKAQGKRRKKLTRAIESMLNEDFAGRILSYDREAAIECALIRAKRQRMGRPIGNADAQIAGIARSRRSILATRNLKDFEKCGLTVINPWNP